MNGSCRRAWTGLPTFLPPAAINHQPLCIRESSQVVALGPLGPRGPHVPTRSSDVQEPQAPTLASCGRSRAGLERGRLPVSCIIRWLLNLLTVGWCFPYWDVLWPQGVYLECRASSVDTPVALRHISELHLHQVRVIYTLPMACCPCSGSYRCARAMHRRFET